MNSIKEMQNRENIILTVQLSKTEFNCLQYYIGCENQNIIMVTTEECMEDLSFCLSKEDKESILKVKPDIIKFVSM